MREFFNWLLPIWANLYQFIWANNDPKEPTWIYLGQFEPIWTNQKIWSIQTHLDESDQFGPIKTYLDQSEPIRSHSDQSGLIRTHLYQSRTIWTNLDQFELIRTNLN